MHYCSYIAATEGRTDFSSWGIPHTIPISIEYIHSIPRRSKSCCLHQIWEFISPQAEDLGLFCSPSPEFPWQIKGLYAKPAKSNSQQPISFNLPRWVEKNPRTKKLILARNRNQSVREKLRSSAQSRKALNPKKRKKTKGQCSV